MRAATHQSYDLELLSSSLRILMFLIFLNEDYLEYEYVRVYNITYIPMILSKYSEAYVILLYR